MGRHRHRALQLLIAALAAAVLWPSAASAAGINVFIGSLTIPTVNAQTANLWVNTVAGASPQRCAVACTYDSTKAYSSIQNAVAACSPGDTIGMQNGSYGAQTITTNLTSPGCTVIGASRSGVVLASLTTHGDNFAIQNATISGSWSIDKPGVGHPNGVSLTHVDFSSGSGDRIWMNGGQNISLTDSDMGPNLITADGQEPIYIEGVAYTLTNVTFDGLVMHDTTRSTTTSHVEDIRIDQGADHITVKNSTFGPNLLDNTSTIFITNGTSTTTDPNNVVIENNFFMATVSGQPSIKTQDPVIANCNNIRVRYNTFLGGSLVTACTSSTGTTEYKANVGHQPGSSAGAQCPGAFTYSYNIITSNGTCAATDVFTTTPGLGGSDGFHLTAGSAAIGAGDPADCPATDHDGEGRPQPAATTCDSGADEVN